MNHYDRDNILDLCSQSHRLACTLAKKVGVDHEEIEDSQQRLRAMADKVSKALCNRPLYTVTVTRCLADNTVKHENVLTTPIAEEALQLRDDINQDSPLFGAKRIAQVICREVKPRIWKLWAQTAENEIHLRCQTTNARALLRSAAPEVLARLYCGKTLVQDRSIYLQSEKIEVKINFSSTRDVKVAEGGGRVVTHAVKACTPVVVDFDVNDFSELTVDARAGVVAKFPIQDGMLMLPGNLATALRMEGMALPIRDFGNGKTRVRLTSLELLSRLKLSHVTGQRRMISRLSEQTHQQSDLLAA